MGGPIWTAPMHDSEWVKKAMQHIEENVDLYNQSKKIYGMLTVMNDELPDIPLFYAVDSLSNTVHVNTPPLLQVR